MHHETYQGKSKTTQLWLMHHSYRKRRKPPGPQALQDVLGVSNADALFERTETTLSPWAFFWQFPDVVGEVDVDGALVLRDLDVYLVPLATSPVQAAQGNVYAASPDEGREEVGGHVLRRFVNLKNAKDGLLLVA